MGSIYKITNTVNQKSYIGISIHEPETGRIRDHLEGRGNRILAEAIDKYGRNAFTYEILEENVFDEFLPELEKAYIAKFDTVKPNGYNLTYGGEGGGSPSEETREKMSLAQRGKIHSKETREKLSFALRGHPVSKETREKIAATSRGRIHSKETREQMSLDRRGRTHSKETREKISRAHRGKSVSQEAREKMSIAQRGKRLSKETRGKIAAANRGKKYSQETREKISRVQRGKKLSQETRERISRAKRSPDYMPAREFFLSLPYDLSLREKRRLLLQKFAERSHATLYQWINEWIQES